MKSVVELLQDPTVFFYRSTTTTLDFSNLLKGRGLRANTLRFYPKGQYLEEGDRCRNRRWIRVKIRNEISNDDGLTSKISDR